MDDDIREQLYQLFESEKYLLQLDNQILNIDVSDLPPVIGNDLVDNYIRNEYIKEIGNCLDEILRPLPSPKIVFSGAPRKHIREISSDDIGKLRTINAIVISINQPKSFVKNACFYCPSCSGRVFERQYSPLLKEPDHCICGNKKNLVFIEEKSEWDDYQELKIQENPEEIEIGVIPRTMRVAVIGNHLVDMCQAGDVVDLTCILRTRQDKRKKDRIFPWWLQGVYIDVLTKDAFNVELSEADIEMVKEWASDGRIADILIESIYPSIYGYSDEKHGLTLCLFGGVEKKPRDIMIRGQSNCLLIGDPSTAKTALILAASKVAPKGIYTQAGGASGVGLTAAAVKEGDEWILEAGAVVLANGGICCVDEIEKMSNDDRKKLHECMEIQTVTIHKANIHTTLNAKTAILAAANPKYGRFDPNYTVAENINLPPPILARFDLIYIMRDIPQEDLDEKIAKKIMDVIAGEDSSKLPKMSTEEIKKYILYAKSIKPKLTERARNRLVEFYKNLRSSYDKSENKPIPITPRQMQGMSRLAQAHARMYLREQANIADAELAIELIMETLHRAAIDPSTGLIDTTGLEQGKTTSKTKKRQMVELCIPYHPSTISRGEIYLKCREIMTEEEVDEILLELTNAPLSEFSESGGKYKRVSSS